jgi:hypothetical protein
MMRLVLARESELLVFQYCACGDASIVAGRRRSDTRIGVRRFYSATRVPDPWYCWPQALGVARREEQGKGTVWMTKENWKRRISPRKKGRGLGDI